MDDLVIKSLVAFTKREWSDESVEDYVRYIDLARDVAYEANTTEDVVEWKLWRTKETVLEECCLQTSSLRG
jgi:hypothetical protein